MDFELFLNLIFNRFNLVLIVLVDDIHWICSHIVQMFLKALIEFFADQTEYAKLGFHVKEFYHVREYTWTDFWKRL